MACCGSKPRVKLLRTTAFRPEYGWHDTCRPGTPARQVQWLFYRNGQFVCSTAYGAPTDPLAIGSGSNYSWLNATDADIVSFLIGQGVTTDTGDFIQVRVRIRNCDNERAISNPIGLIAPDVSATCTCSFVRAYDNRQTGTNPVPPVGFTPVGGQLFFVNGLLAEIPLTDPLINDDELLWLTLSGGCEDSFATASTTGATGNVTVPGGFITAVPDSTRWIVTRNGIIQSGFGFSFGTTLVPSVPSEPEDEWTFIGLTGGDCSLITVPVSGSATGSSINLPSEYSAANASKFIPVRGGLLMYESAGSESGYTISGSTLVPDVPFDQEEIWLIAIE